MDKNRANKINWRALSWEQMGQWPMHVKISTLFGLSLLIIIMGYRVGIQDSVITYMDLKAQEKSLKVNFERKQQQIFNRAEYHQQLNLITKYITEMINNFPVKNEIPDLLEEISNAALISGLTLELFMPQAEIVCDFYVTLPIKILVQGTYFQLADFINQIAKMKRVVTLHKFSIKRVSSKNHKIILDDELVMDITVKIYRQRTS